MTKKAKSPDLEKSLLEIETIIEKMESGKLNLEKSLEEFEKGIKLIKNSQSILNSAEQKVQTLLNKDGKDLLKDYNDEAE